MIRRTPQTVTYKDLVSMAKGFRNEAERRYAGARDRQVGNLSALHHHLECTRTLVRMLKKGEPGRQVDMVELFNQTR